MVATQKRTAERTKNMKNRMASLLILLLLCTVLANASAESRERDNATPYGDYLGENYVRESNTLNEHVYVLGNKLFMHATFDLNSEPVHTLVQGQFAELLDSKNGALLVRAAVGSSSDDVIYIEGWVDERFVVISKGFYIAMHPTPVYIDATTDAKIIRLMDTYDSLIVIDESDGFYRVMMNGGIGFVEKE